MLNDWTVLMIASYFASDPESETESESEPTRVGVGVGVGNRYHDSASLVLPIATKTLVKELGVQRSTE